MCDASYHRWRGHVDKPASMLENANFQRCALMSENVYATAFFDQLHDDFMSMYVACVANPLAKPTALLVEMNQCAVEMVAIERFDPKSPPADDALYDLRQLFQNAELVGVTEWSDEHGLDTESLSASDR